MVKASVSSGSLFVGAASGVSRLGDSAFDENPNGQRDGAARVAFDTVSLVSDGEATANKRRVRPRLADIPHAMSIPRSTARTYAHESYMHARQEEPAASIPIADSVCVMRFRPVGSFRTSPMSAARAPKRRQAGRGGRLRDEEDEPALLPPTATKATDDAETPEEFEYHSGDSDELGGTPARARAPTRTRCERARGQPHTWRGQYPQTVSNVFAEGGSDDEGEDDEDDEGEDDEDEEAGDDDSDGD